MNKQCVELCRRVRLVRWDADLLYVRDIADGEDALLRVVVPADKCYGSLRSILHLGCRLNLLEVGCSGEVLLPRNIIYEPDYLVETTSLCACIQEHGNSPLTYILNLFKESKATRHTLLGEAANLFLDDVVNESAGNVATYKGSVAKFFREYPLQLTATEGIGADFSMI